MTLRSGIFRSTAPLLALLLALLLFALLLALPPAAALAAGQFGVGAFGSYNTYSMSDLNDEFVDPLNELFASAGSPARMDHLSNGPGFGGGLRWHSFSGLGVALDYERLTGSTDVSDQDETIEVDGAANAVTATVTYFLSSASRARFGLGLGIGYYSAAGAAKYYAASTGETFEEKLEGSGFGFHGGGALDLALSEQAHLESFVGYRFAKTTDLKIGGDPIMTSDGDDATLDWSGLMARVGVGFYFGFLGAQ